jgi:adenylate kinase
MIKSAGMEINKVIVVEVPDEIIVGRLGGRRVCVCGESYHIEDKKPKMDGVCDACGKELIIRKDDDPEVIKGRLKTYHEQTEPIIDFYKNENIDVRYINANRPFSEAEMVVKEAFE